MLTLDELKKIDKIEYLRDVELGLMCDYYEDVFLPIEIKYEVRDLGAISLTFEKAHFAHLLGLHYIATTAQFRGVKAWEGMRDGTHTLEKYKGVRPGYGSLSSRVQYFPSLIKALNNPFACMYNAKNVETGKRGEPILVADFIVYDEVNRKFIHLGLSKYRPDKLKCFPRSFFPRDDDTYIAGQTPLAIVDRWITQREGRIPEQHLDTGVCVVVEQKRST